MAVSDQPDDHVARIIAAWERERPDLDPAPQAVIGRLHRVANALTERLTAVYARFGLSEAEFDLLASLRRSGAPYALPAGTLAEHTMVTTGGLTKRVDRLERRGLVIREGTPDDARRRLVRLTEAGVSLIDEAFTAHLENERRLLALIDPAEAAALAPVLTRWLRALER